MFGNLTSVDNVEPSYRAVVTDFQKDLSYTLRRFPRRVEDENRFEFVS